MNFKKIKNIIARQKYLTSVYNLTSSKHPQDLVYEGFSGSAALVPIEKCRSNMLGYTTNGNPFVKTLKAYSDKESGYSGSLLEAYYEQFCPISMRAVLESDNINLEKYHPMATVMPWSTATPDEKFLRACIDVNAPNILSREAHKLGLSTKDSFGWQYFGPISENLGQLEYERLISVYKTIKENGYHPNQYGYIHGQFLVNDKDWVWVNIGGKHRFATLAALEFKTIPIALRSRSSALFIHRSEAEYWPNVKNGLFTKQDALDIFDRIMAGSSYYSLDQC